MAENVGLIFRQIPVVKFQPDVQVGQVEKFHAGCSLCVGEGKNLNFGFIISFAGEKSNRRTRGKGLTALF